MEKRRTAPSLERSGQNSGNAFEYGVFQQERKQKQNQRRRDERRRKFPPVDQRLLFKRGFFQRIDLLHCGGHAVGILRFVVAAARVGGDLLKQPFVKIALNLLIAASGERFDRGDGNL